ncbi:MAG TPA: hypothetical protein RMF84_15410 [Polyangiaceae bacterium LLY-WYZ-14_1]|nr:hypothetical protein [Polyangiaceae bacterium LLY-WYZ-14_1]
MRGLRSRHRAGGLAWGLVVIVAVACGESSDHAGGLFDASTTVYADGMSLRPEIQGGPGDDPVVVACGTASPTAGGDAIAATVDACFRTPGGVTAIRATEGEDRH